MGYFESEMTEVAVAWYTKEEWGKVRACAADVEAFSDTYEEWRAKAERTVRTLRRRGLWIVRLPVTAAELEAWCLEDGVPNTGPNRATFAARQLDKMRASGRGPV